MVVPAVLLAITFHTSVGGFDRVTISADRVILESPLSTDVLRLGSIRSEEAVPGAEDRRLRIVADDGVHTSANARLEDVRSIARELTRLAGATPSG